MTIVSEQRSAARVAGLFYLLMMFTGLFGEIYLRSPRIVGVGMVIASLGWLTFLSPPLANALYPYNLLPGIAGEGLLTVWLLAKGVNAERWKEQMQ